MKYLVYVLGFIVFFSCENEKAQSPACLKLNEEEVNKLVELPLYCIETEYPNKLGQTLSDSTDLKEPSKLHPAFYGCFDWHSSVHGHWSLVKLLKEEIRIERSLEIRNLLQKNLSEENILSEVEYFNKSLNKTFERTYGWAWYLKLVEELHTWDDPLARELESNLKPLTELIISRYTEFLPKLNYPVRVGTHSNTAFGLAFAMDYAKSMGDKNLMNIISNSAKRFYLKDRDCPINWEPDGYDFLSPCLQEAALMKTILDQKEYLVWLKNFLPDLFDKNYELMPGEVSDRTDGLLVHLDGVNFSRAWCLNIIRKNVHELNHLKDVANQHISYSLPHIFGDDYEGGHWLASFAIYALGSCD